MTDGMNDDAKARCARGTIGDVATHKTTATAGEGDAGGVEGGVANAIADVAARGFARCGCGR